MSLPVDISRVLPEVYIAEALAAYRVLERLTFEAVTWCAINRWKLLLSVVIELVPNSEVPFMLEGPLGDHA